MTDKIIDEILKLSTKTKKLRSNILDLKIRFYMKNTMDDKTKKIENRSITFSIKNKNGDIDSFLKEKILMNDFYVIANESKNSYLYKKEIEIFDTESEKILLELEKIHGVCDYLLQEQAVI